MTSYKILKDFGDFKEGDIVNETADELIEVSVENLIADGVFEEVIEEIPPAPIVPETPGASALPPEGDTSNQQATDPAVGEQVTKTFVFNGKTVISKTVRVIEDKEVHHVKLEDGTEMDLSDEEHDAMIEASKVA